MLSSPTRSEHPSHRAVCGLLIVVSAATMLGRLMTVRSDRGNTPMLSANDRSRWGTIRALVDEGTYVLDHIVFRSPGVRDPVWYSIDLVQHRGPDGRQHYYSSKPTLLSTLLAAPYWIIRNAAGISIARQPFYVMRLTLALVHVAPLVGFLMLLPSFLDRMGASPWSRQYVVAAAAFATPLTTFSITLNNHLPGALCAFVCIASVVAVLRADVPRIGPFALAGAAGAMAVACELPALSLLALVAVLLARISLRRTLLGFAPPVLVVMAAAFGTNYLAHGTWSTPYAHRRDGTEMMRLETVASAQLQSGTVQPWLREQLAAGGLSVSAESTLSERPLDRGYQLWDPASESRYALRFQDGGVSVREWDNWYEYDGSYWAGRTQGVDRGEPSKWVYTFHALFGHHGLLSLTPIWLLSAVGAARGSFSPDRPSRTLAWMTVTLTIVCLAFYLLLRPLEDRNYGGVSCCFRWCIWLIPLWLATMLPALDSVARRPWLRRLALLLLALSVFSATYNSRNPWSHPWIFDYWTHLGWIKY